MAEGRSTCAKKARPAPAVTEPAWPGMPGWSRATAPLTGTSSGGFGPPRVPEHTHRGPRTPPEHRSFRCSVPVLLPVPAGSSCVSAGTSLKDELSVAAGPGGRRCVGHRGPVISVTTRLMSR